MEIKVREALKCESYKQRKSNSGPRGFRAYDDEVGGDEEKPRGTEGTPGESPQEESRPDAGRGEAGDENGRAADEDQEVAEDGGLPSGRGRLDQGQGPRESSLRRHRARRRRHRSGEPRLAAEMIRGDEERWRRRFLESRRGEEEEARGRNRRGFIAEEGEES